MGNIPKLIQTNSNIVPMDTDHPMEGTLKKPEMLIVPEVALEKRRSEYTVRLALRDQSLHGEKPVGSNRWLIQRECADAWSAGNKCEHYAQNIRRVQANHLKRA